MARLRLSASALRDLERIRRLGVERFGVAAAAKHLAGFERRFALLRAHPSAGALRPELGRNMRAVGHRPHLIIYHVAGDDVLIARIVHQAQDLTDGVEDWP